MRRNRGMPVFPEKPFWEKVEERLFILMNAIAFMTLFLFFLCCYPIQTIAFFIPVIFLEDFQASGSRR